MLSLNLFTLCDLEKLNASKTKRLPFLFSQDKESLVMNQKYLCKKI